MKDATKLDVYFNGDQTLFLIPLYQRNYAWKQKHCERLFSDLEKIHKNNIYSHFFGSIVSVKANEWDDDLLIIDGQQRITTISLLVLAAIHSVKKGIMACNMGDEYLKDQANKYLMAKYRNVDRKIKLRPIDQDKKAYDALFLESPDDFISADKSGITSNYQLFCALIKTTSMTFEDLIQAIGRLIIIDIRLDSKDNPQLIFESLNSCGKDLEESDKVRNYLFMSLSAQEQEYSYRHYWSKIETNTTSDESMKDPTMFIRDYLTIKTKTISNITELYFDFKRFDEGNSFSRKELFEDMLKYSIFYRWALKAEGLSEKTNRKLRQLSYIGSMVCMPFYLSFFDYVQCHELDEDVVYNVLNIIENYWARRIICGYPANAMAKTFALLHSDVMRIINQHKKRDIELNVGYDELVKYVLLRKQGNSLFPNDTMVRENFPKRQVYRIPIDYRCFLFERMEKLGKRKRKIY